MKYSVLMSVYHKEKAEYLRQSISSMLEQTLSPDDFVIVCDGPLTEALDEVLDDFAQGNPGLVRIVRLEHNRGLGLALREGLQYCRYNLVARMDSDDVAHRERCKRQIAFLEQHSLDLCSGTVAEFQGDLEHISTYRRLPARHDEIVAYAHRRNPMNHPCVMFRRNGAISAGNYQHVPFFEDFDLWVRMLQGGARAGNLTDILVYMRVDRNAYLRRGGISYCKAIREFWRRQKRTGFISRWEYIRNLLVRCTVSLLPNIVRGAFFRNALRSR